jgi:hypothetical protein
MKVIFLDIDGVIVTNHYLTGLERNMQPWRYEVVYAHFCPRCLAHVNELVARTGATVVLSSTWRFFLEDLDSVRRFFRSRGIRFEIHDVTPLVDHYPGKPSRNDTRASCPNNGRTGCAPPSTTALPAPNSKPPSAFYYDAPAATL